MRQRADGGCSVDLHQLEIFVAVIDSASVTKASESVHLSPGAVSLQLQHLAKELKTELFLRSGRNLVPTPAALQLAEYSRPLLHQMKHIQRTFLNEPDEDERPFRFATGVTTLIYRLAGPLRKLRKLHPNTEIQVTVSVTEDIVRGLLDRRFDLGLISLPVDETGLNIVPLYDEELLLLRPSGERVRYSHVHSVSPAEVADLPFLFYPRHSNMRGLIDRYLGQLGIKPRVVMEAEDTETIKGLVEAGFGGSMLPEHAVRGQSRFFELLRIGNHRLIRRQALATVQTNFPRQLTASVADFLQAALSVSKLEKAVSQALHDVAGVEPLARASGDGPKVSKGFVMGASTSRD